MKLLNNAQISQPLRAETENDEVEYQRGRLAIQWAFNEGGKADIAWERIYNCTDRQAVTLSLSDLGLVSLPPLRKLIPRLQSLDISNNSLADVELTKILPTQLKALSLAHTALTHLPKFKEELPELESLNLKDNNIPLSELENGLFANLTMLSLENMGLTHLPPLNELLPQLEALDLSNNRIVIKDIETKLPPSLKALSLVDTALTHLPKLAKRLTMLRALNVSNNCLRYLKAPSDTFKKKSKTEENALPSTLGLLNVSNCGLCCLTKLPQQLQVLIANNNPQLYITDKSLPKNIVQLELKNIGKFEPGKLADFRNLRTLNLNLVHVKITDV